MAKKNVLVIGGGIVGICVARELQSLGHEVEVVDKGAIGQGCSFANAGWITPCFAMPLPQPGLMLKSLTWLLNSKSPLYIKPSLEPLLVRWLWRFMLATNRKKMLRSIEALTAISKYSLSFYTEFAARTESTGFQRNGLLMVSATEAGVEYAKKEMRLMADQGIAGEFMDEHKVREFEPALKGIVKGGVFFPDEAQIEPFTTTVSLAKEFTNLGGKLHFNTEVYDFEVAGGKIEEVVTTRGRFRPDLVVLAAGSWSPELAKRLALRIPLMGGKGYSMSMSGGTRPARPIMIVDKKIAITPMADSTRVAGTLELVNQDFSISPTRVRAILEGAREYLHLPTETEPENLWRGLRPCTPDGVPIIGFSKKLSNLFYCTGHQMLGLQSAPGSAKLAGQLIQNEAPLTDPAPFSPYRFE